MIEAKWIEKQCPPIEQDIRKGIPSKRGYETLKTNSRRRRNRDKLKTHNVIETKEIKLLT